MGHGDSANDFDPSERMKNAGILDVFPVFHAARLGQKIRRSPQFPLCGAAQVLFPKVMHRFSREKQPVFIRFFSGKGAKTRPGGNFRFPEKWGQKTESLPIVRTMETIYKKKAIFRGKLYVSFRKKA